jgi:dipeptidyl aminopeptidase/acylaminoacyl peptidase
MVDVRTGADVRVPLPALSNAQQYPVLLPEGDVLFAAAPDHPQVFANAYQFFRVPITGAPATPITPEIEDQPAVADLSPDGHTIAYLSNSQVWVVPVGGGDPRVVAAGPAGWFEGAVRWSPDGTHLAVNWQAPPPMTNGAFIPRYVGQIVGLDGSRVALPIAPSDASAAATWSPDSRYVAYDVKRAKVGRDGFGTRIVVVSAAGKIVHTAFPRSADSPLWLARP